MNRGLGFQGGVGRVWRSSNAHPNNLLLRCVGKKNLTHETSKLGMAGTQEGSKWSMGMGLGSQEPGNGLRWFRKGRDEPSKGFKRGLGFQGSSEWGGKALEVVQCTAQQLLVAEVCWEEEFSTWDGTSKVVTGRYPGRLKMKHGEGLGLRITF